MTDAQKAQLLRSFVPVEKAAADAAIHAWELTKGTMIFPEGRCPYCREVIRAKNIWIAERGKVTTHIKVNVAGKLTASRDIRHPHTHTSGGICMGNQKFGSEAAALFLGLNPNDSYWDSSSWFRWLKTEFGHDCPRKQDYVE